MNSTFITAESRYTLDRLGEPDLLGARSSIPNSYFDQARLARNVLTEFKLLLASWRSFLRYWLSESGSSF